MNAEAVSLQETLGREGRNKQKVADFIKGMKIIKFAGARGSLNLDSFFLLTYNQITKKDEIDYVSWAKDKSRYPYNFAVTLNKLKLPRGKDHPPFNKRSSTEDTGKKIPVIAFGMGPESRAFLFRRRDMSTKISFERIREAIGLF
jgi:hypothetical protein